MEFLLTQSIEHKGRELDLALLHATSLIEYMDLRGPVLMLTFTDRYGLIRDSYQVHQGDEIKVKISDLAHSQALDEVNSYRVMDVTLSSNKQYKLMCWDTRIASLYERATRASAFIGLSVKEMLSRLVPGLKYDVDPYPLISDYYLTAGARPVQLLRTLAAEHGAALWLDREGVLRFKSLANYLDQTPSVMSYVDDDPLAPNRMVKPKLLGQRQLTEEILARRYHGWHMQKGPIASTTHAQSSPVHTANSHKIMLEAESASLVPLLGFEAGGNGSVAAGAVLDLVWNRKAESSPIDESMPELGVVTAVTHHAEMGAYLIRPTVGVIHA